MTKKSGTTSAKVASKASDLLRNPKSSAKVKSVAAAALANAADNPKRKKTK